jgi:hypothetical protein
MDLTDKTWTINDSTNTPYPLPYSQLNTVYDKLPKFILYNSNDLTIELEHLYDVSTKEYHSIEAKNYSPEVLEQLKQNIKEVLENIIAESQKTVENELFKDEVISDDLIDIVSLGSFLTKLFSRLYIVVLVQQTIINVTKGPSSDSSTKIKELKSKIIEVSELLFSLDSIPQ